MRHMRRTDQTPLADLWLKPWHSLFFVRQYWLRSRYRKYFDTIEKFPLTRRQRQAIIVDEKRCLVIAGAGTGKTATIIGKIGFLIKSGKAKPEEILGIAYNNKAAKEMKARVQEKIGSDVKIGTFHSIGKEILDQSGYPSRPHEFIDQEEKLLSFMNLILKHCLKTEDFGNLYSQYFKNHEFPNIDEVRDFKTMSEYANWLRSNKLLTLNREIVKSHGELLIANFLFRNGINYKYEANYAPANSMPPPRHYRPDFCLPEHKIYIEYFGIDENGNTAEFVPSTQYHKAMKWKHKIHERGRTKLVPLYFHQKRKGNLLESLETQLLRLGVNFNPISKDQLFQAINSSGRNRRFLELVKRFLDQYKERKNTVNVRKLRDEVDANDKRTLLFLDIFEMLLHAYQEELKKIGEGEIDFGDMISEATELVSQNPKLSPYKYIIIDEFQDISEGRYGLINAFLRQNPKTKLFCVGDDWQAIYQFAGSDHKIMTGFAQRFGKATTLKLDLTFRYNDKIAEVSEKFVTKNPSQIRKNIRTNIPKETPQVFVHWHADSPADALQETMQAIHAEYAITADSLLILSRYRHNKIEGKDLDELKQRWGGGKIEQHTIHAAKGLEADFVIVTDIQSGDYGFPSEFQDDPILQLMLSESDKFPYGEERRLLYVALTRAKKQSHLICDSTEPSRFALELVEDEYPIQITSNQDIENKCPDCSDGRLVKKRGRRGHFHSCSNYPLCKFKPFACPVCESIVLREKSDKNQNIAICQSEDCRKVLVPCNRCRFGVFKKVAGPNGVFLACHDFLRTGCEGTRNIANAGRTNPPTAAPHGNSETRAKPV